jgi:hypothetical protein
MSGRSRIVAVTESRSLRTGDRVRVLKYQPAGTGVCGRFGGSATRQLPATAEDVVRPVAQGNSVEAVFAPPLREPSWLPLSTPVTIRAFAGDNYAEPSAFGTIEFFKPLNSWQFTSGDEQVEYLNTRAALSREGGGLINLGYGRRHYFADSDIIVDGNAWIDGDHTTGTLFPQVALGGQIESSHMLVRGHYYHPFGETQQNVGYTPLTGGRSFGGNQLLLDRSRLVHHAFHGFEAEVGCYLATGSTPSLASIGYYHFSSEQLPKLAGRSGRLQAVIFDGFSAGLNVTSDSETDTSVLANLTCEFNNAPPETGTGIRRRLLNSVQRHYHVVRREVPVFDPLPATLASTGAEVRVVHASSAGAAPGNGAFETPFTDVASAAASAATVPDSIIFAHGGSVFNGQSIVVPDGVRFLGEGQTHQINTAELGNITLPAASGIAVAPIIANSPVGLAAISAGSMTEINGLTVQNAGGTGILVNGINSSSLVSNVSVNGAVDGVRVTGNTGTSINFVDLTVTNTTGTGIFAQNTSANFSGTTTVNGTAADGVFIGSTQNAQAVTFAGPLNISNSGLAGLRMANNADASLISFNDAVTVTTTAGHGIHFDRNADEALAVFSGPTTVTGAGGDGIHISNVDPGGTLLTATHINFQGTTTVNTSTGAGVMVDNHGGNVGFQNLQVLNWTPSAIVINNSTGDFTVVDPLNLNNVTGSLAATILLSNATGSTTFGDVTITDTSRGALGNASVSILNSNTGVDFITFNSLNVTTNQGGGGHFRRRTPALPTVDCESTEVHSIRQAGQLWR